MHENTFHWKKYTHDNKLDDVDLVIDARHGSDFILFSTLWKKSPLKPLRRPTEEWRKYQRRPTSAWWLATSWPPSDVGRRCITTFHDVADSPSVGGGRWAVGAEDVFGVSHRDWASGRSGLRLGLSWPAGGYWIADVRSQSGLIPTGNWRKIHHLKSSDYRFFITGGWMCIYGGLIWKLIVLNRITLWR